VGKGANLNLRDAQGRTALDYARLSGQEDIVQYFEQRSPAIPDAATP
jgi:ankyrin repeat protein